MSEQIDHYLQKIVLPQPLSHKGQNGKLLIIGGSELFHAASKWSLDIASKFVDMVFYSSVPSNNQLVQEAKQGFWNGLVIAREEIENYINEADCVLIGPGMTRSDETKEIVTTLLHKYATKKWVIDAGALQMIEAAVIPARTLITPHQGEIARLFENSQWPVPDHWSVEALQPLLEKGITVVLKGPEDHVFSQDMDLLIAGGNAGMTKGGTGDVLAGLVAALYCTHDALTAAAISSYINKKTGEFLYQTVGPYFNASDLVSAIPQVFWTELQRVKGE